MQATAYRVRLHSDADKVIAVVHINRLFSGDQTFAPTGLGNPANARNVSKPCNSIFPNL
jgi:hypothetical protein